MNKYLDAYLAGLIDGEGCITIVRNNHRTQKGQLTPFTYPKFVDVLTVGLTDQSTVELFRTAFGGSIYYKPPKKNRRAAWYWWADKKTLPICLARLLPFIRLKKKQAKLLLRFRSRMHRKITEAEFNRRDTLHRLMKRLNHPPQK